MPTFSHLVGLEIEEKCRIGLAYFPILKKYYITQKINLTSFQTEKEEILKLQM